METKTETKHTPGPWTVSGRQVKSIDHGKRYTVATTNNPKFTDEANASNAWLIAAAPDLFKALREIVAAVEAGEADGYAPSGDWFREAKAALDKATG